MANIDLESNQADVFNNETIDHAKKIKFLSNVMMYPKQKANCSIIR